MTNNEFLLKYLSDSEYKEFIHDLIVVEVVDGVGSIGDVLEMLFEEALIYNEGGGVGISPISALFVWPNNKVGYWSEINRRVMKYFIAEPKKQLIKLDL